MRRFLYFLLGLAGLPLMVALIRMLASTLAKGLLPDTIFAPAHWGFIAGAGLFILVYIRFKQRLSITYTFAHEMTHAFAGLCCFAKVHRISVEESGGFVQLSKDNWFITLAPYCLPFYFLIIVLLRIAIGFFFEETFWIQTGWNFVLGFTLAFHILYTIDALITVSQPDVHVYGRLFSYWLIISLNVLFFTLSLTWIYRLSIASQSVEFLQETTSCYITTGRWLAKPIHWLTKDTSQQKGTPHEQRR